MAILKKMHDICFIEHPNEKKTYKKVHSTETLSKCIIMMETCAFLCSIGQGLETNLGCFYQALVAL